MKKILCLLVCAVSWLSAEVKEVSLESGERKVMFDLLRPEVAKQAGRKPSEVKFEGSLKQGGNWAFFAGGSRDADSQPLVLKPAGNDDTCALFIHTYRGWMLVDWSAGHSDAFYLVWAKTYGVTPEVLGLKAD